MAIVRKEQLAAFSRPVEHDLACRSHAHVTATFPRHCARLSQREVRRRVEEGMAQAEQYGIEGDYDVLRFVDLLFLLGPDFGADPDLRGIREILHDDETTGAERLDRIYERIKQRGGAACRHSQPPAHRQPTPDADETGKEQRGNAR